MSDKHISLVSDFTDAPGGRFRSQGTFSGEEFRDDVLIPALESHDLVIVNLDGALGLPASFLDEAFGVVGRKNKPLVVRLRVELTDNSVGQSILEECLPGSSLSWTKR